MNRIYIFMMAVTLILVSCSEGFIEESQQNKIDSTTMIRVTDEGYLSFKTKNAFENYLNQLKSETIQCTTRNISSYLNGFTSLNDLQSKLKNDLTRNIIEDNEDDCEEGSEDEYKLSLAQELLKDDILYNVMDTTLRISIDDIFYKITEQGTFYCNQLNSNKITDIISTFDKNKLIQISDDLYKINDDFYFCDSFGRMSKDNTGDFELVENEDAIPIEMSTRSIAFGNESYNASMYGLKTYAWKNKTLVGKFTSWLFGKDVTKEQEFDSKHKICCELFQVNYSFYASTGFKVKMQKRKKFLFVKYWVNTECQDLVIGIERLSGKMKFNYNPGKVANYATFTNTWQGVVNNMVYSGLQRPTFIEDWITNNIVTIFPGIKEFNFLKWKIDPWAWTQDLTKDAIYAGLNSLTGELSYAVGKKLAKEDPRIAMVMGKKGELETHIMGINNFGIRNSKTIRFSQSAGISISLGGLVVGYIPEKFAITQAEIFGAVKYNGKWKGIRFTHNL